MGKKYFDTKPGTLESTVIGVWTDAIKEQDGEYKKVFQAAMKKFGVKCTLICPGLVESQIRYVNNKGQYKPDAKDPAPDWIIMDTKTATAQMKKAILKGKKEVIITGHGKIMVFIQRHFPWLVDFLNSKNIMSG